MLGPFFSLNGNLYPVDEARVSIDDLAFSYGFGVYETLKVRKGIVFFPELHEERIFHSASILSLPHPWKTGDFRRIVSDLVIANALQDSNLKAILIGGSNASSSRLYVMALNPLFPDRKNYKTGVAVTIYLGERPFPQAKSLNMLMSYLAYRQAQERDAYDALLVNRFGEITEGTRTNFFVTDGTSVFTPPADQVLPGVTKQTVSAVIRSLGIPLVEQALPLETIKNWKGAFITSTSTKIMPVRKIGDAEIRLDPLVSQLVTAYDDYLADYTSSQRTNRGDE